MEPVFIKKLKNRLEQNLPGSIAQDKMKIKPNLSINKFIDKKNIRPAAVLILLYPIKQTDWYFFLTKRSLKVDHHKGQISLPGGMIEKNELKKDAATREAFEEIGVSQKKINIIGSLTNFSVPVSRFEIFPFIGWINNKPKTKIQITEVEKVFSISIKSLLNPEKEKFKDDILSGVPVKIPYFDLNNEMVWGATSIILSEFKHILEEII